MDSPQRTEFFEQVIARTKLLPGVEAAAMAAVTPYANQALVQ